MRSIVHNSQPNAVAAEPGTHWRLSHDGKKVSQTCRRRALPVAALCALATFAVTAPPASAQYQNQGHGSCVGVLSAVIASVQDDDLFRQDFAPVPGQVVAGLGAQKGNAGFCASLIDL